MISVIVPVYNVENYLRECLDSLLAQTYPSLEIILVDDGSTDRSGQICEEYAKNHENMRVIHKQNQGLGMARNTGLEHISGEYVAFVDSDDYLDADCLEQLYNGLQEKKVDYCKCGFKRVDDNRNLSFVKQYKEEHYVKDDAAKMLLPRLIGSRPDVKDSIEPCVWGVLYASRHIKEHQIRFPSERELISEDVVFHIDYMQYADGAYVIPYAGYNYRRNDASLTKTYRSDRFEACCIFYTRMKAKLLSLGYDAATLLRLSRIFFVYLRACIAQETGSVSGLSRRQNLEHIKKICSDSIVRQVMEEYPVCHLGIKQKLFLYLIKYKMTYILYYMAKMKLL